MAIVIGSVQTKGGVGKSTLTHNLGSALAEQGYKVGVIDFDDQRSLSDFVGVPVEHIENSDIRKLVLRKEPLKITDFQYIPSSNIYFIHNKADIDPDFFYEPQIGVLDKFTLLKRILKDIDYLDFILIDTPGAEGLNVYNTMIASNYIIIPTTLERAAINPLYKLMNIINDVKVELNPLLKVIGILKMNFDSRNKTTNKLEEVLETDFQGFILETKIRTNRSFSKANELNMDIFQVEDEKGISDFRDLVKEILVKIDFK